MDSIKELFVDLQLSAQSPDSHTAPLDSQRRQ
jgi:hypothetical protein